MFKLMLVILLLRLKTTLVKRNSLIKQKALALVYLLVMILVTSVLQQTIHIINLLKEVNTRMTVTYITN